MQNKIYGCQSSTVYAKIYRRIIVRIVIIPAYNIYHHHDTHFMSRLVYSFIFALCMPFVVLKLFWRGYKAPEYRTRKLERFGLFKAPNLKGKKILIAEDNNINQVLIKAMMAKTNADITIVENGQLAFEAVGSERFDLVLMDIHVPIMDGIQSNQRIKAMQPNLPVIALTANVMDKDVQHYYQQGFISHVAKPIDINDLFGKLKHLFKI